MGHIMYRTPFFVPNVRVVDVVAMIAVVLVAAVVAQGSKNI